MDSQPNITVLSDLGCPYADDLRAYHVAAGNINLVANYLLADKTPKCQSQRHSVPTERAGPSHPLPTPAQTESPETITIDSEVESDADAESDGYDLYTLPTPSCTSVLASTVANGSKDHAEGGGDDLHALPIPITARKASTAHEAATTKLFSHDTKADDYMRKVVPPATPARPLSPSKTPNTGAENSDDEHAGPVCVCQEPHDSNMIQCDTCKRWFHYECVNLAAETIPSGNWDCHFEVNPTSKEMNRKGLKFDDLESRALYLSVKHFAPLGKKFWENVSRYLKTQFNIVRSSTSAKLEWLRNSSAIWGFDERDATQYSAVQMEARRKLMRSLIEGRPAPQQIEFRLIGQGKKSTLPIKKQKPKQTKRERVKEDNNSKDSLPIQANKRRNTAAGKLVGCKSATGKDVNDMPIATELVPHASVTCKTRVARAYIPTPAAAELKVASATETTQSQAHNQAPATANTRAAMVENAPSGAAEATTIQPTVKECGDQLLLDTYPSDFSPYRHRSYGLPPQFHSRFDALAEHRRYVKEMLKDIEPNLDWYEGPWDGAIELLWTSAGECSMKAMFK